MKALIIGFGSIGKKHYLALKHLGYEVSVVSRSYKKNDLQCFKSLQEVKLEEIDLFVIATITINHYETLESIDKKIKGKTILIEKPLFEKYREFNSINGNYIYVAYLLRFHPLVEKIKTIIQKDQYIYFVEFNCSSYLPNWRICDYTQNYSAKKELGGGVLLDLSHELDLAYYFFEKLKLLYAQNLKISELEINSDDFAFLSLKSKKELIHIKLDYFSKFTKREIVLHSRDKTYKADLVNNKLYIFGTTTSLQVEECQSDTIKNLISLHEKIIEKDCSVCNLYEAFDVLKLCDEVKRRSSE
ncbi:Gfo/Idh/MocA family oxidoreductase [Campylobacter sp. IFREMER_LSEM_CL908]|uniref:Gfo/Idh/MocA family protein n=1 Tax=unclassified Campylobacter TaxID=2593542 RepID=UPI0021E64440|nr:MULTISPECIES: Gfo/Idh/MocA family oxidoreductase [unclassified Campylobacter]EID4796344.1 Gfo/Idh/MocA family oxidoreductase [Campylobacter lari]MCV3393257.1 Gfo/Idh/MocA family oxidoreductase [Campylobacter sp. IFREMER_LSEM_CL908]MCV3424401.1 Gfo/Idh/MocA family oxidoreductase [Campylobacter sp. IFREMER_LSEM_CL1085]